MQPPVLLLLVCYFTLALASTNISFNNFLELHLTLSEKKIFVTNFPILTDSLKTPTPHPLNGQNRKSTKCDKSF